MAVRRPGSVCLACQTRQAVVGRRRLSSAASSRHANLGLIPLDNEFPFSIGANPGQNNASRATQHTSNDQYGPREPTLEEKLLDLDELWRTRESRQAVLRKISNPWPSPPIKSQAREASVSKYKNLSEFRETISGPMSHAVFREKVKEAAGPGFMPKPVRYLISAQLLRCDTPKGFLRLFAAVLQYPSTTKYMASLSEQVMRCMYRCRTNASDLEILHLINIFTKRLEMANLPIVPDLVKLGAKFAARARSLRSMKRYLRLQRIGNAPMSSNTFRSLVAKFSIGYRGLGEIRNGRWKREELRQVLMGFNDAAHLPPEQQYHLETFLDRSDWQFLHCWAAVIARCKDGESVWQEWLIWKGSDAYKRPKSLKSMNPSMNSRKRGESWFVEQLVASGNPHKAWKVLHETGLPLRTLATRIKAKLLDAVEFAPVWSEELREAILWKYDWELARIEDQFGVRWVRGAADDGFHELAQDQEEALDKLGSDNWEAPDASHGFFIEEEEMALHRAEEQGLAKATETG